MFGIYCMAQLRAMRRLLIVAMTAALAPAICAAAEPPPRSVLILDHEDPGRYFYGAYSAAFRTTVRTGSAEAPITVYAENMDRGRFDGPSYPELLHTYFKEKYRGKDIGIIVTVGVPALDFILNARANLWSGVPVVFVAAEGFVSQLKLPPDVTGRTAQLSLRDMVDTARGLEPRLAQIALVGDPLERARPSFQRELPTLGPQVKLIDLTGLPMAELRKRVAVLPERTVIAYTDIYVDGAGVNYDPRDAMVAFAEAANRPIVVDAESYIGLGGVGGRVISPGLLGDELARLALRILNGEGVANIPVAKSESVKPIFDERQLKRWKISEASLPEDSEVRFRELTAWAQYHTQILIAFAAVLLQSAIIFGLLLERRRRHAAELESRGRLAQVMHMNRGAGLSAISSSIAHELNQPLGAILSNAQAAEILLRQNPPDLELIGTILADICKSDQRAGEVITHLRDLLRKNDRDPEVVNLNDVIMLAVEILVPEANTRGVKLTANLDPNPLPVRINPIHLQQVILNLALNGMDATASHSPGDRQVAIRAAVINNVTIKVSVADSGSGIPADKLPRIFEPFFTTKEKGTGLGLAIARTIIERSGGQISVENRPNGGAVFRFSLPLVKELVA